MTRHEYIQMRERIVELEATVAGLRGLLRQGCTFTADWDLTVSQERLLSALLTRPSLTYHQAGVAMRPDGAALLDDPYAPVTVQIHSLRKKLAAAEIEITTMRGVGYRLDEENKKKVRLGLTSGLNVES